MTEMEILQTTTDPIEMDMGDPVIEYSPVYPNPEGDPTDDLTKVQIQGDIYKVKDSEVHDWARTEEKPTYTKAEVGLGNVDNTSDLDKPISTATQNALDGKVDNSELGNYYTKSEVNSALDNKADKSDTYTKTETDTALGNKVDKVSGKGLSTNDYDDTAKGIVDGVTSALDGKADKTDTYTKSEVNSALENKVDKVDGYGLSENNYSDTDKTKLDGIEAEANKTIVDTEISATSTNPLQNKAIYDLLNDLLPEATETGNPISISNASGFNAKALTVDMLPIQDLHGYDKPWAGGSGKNKHQLLSSYDTNPSVLSTVTRTYTDGEVTISGTTSSSNTQFYIEDITNLLQTLGTATISLKVLSGDAYNFQIRINIEENGSVVARNSLIGTDRTYTFDSTKTYYLVMFTKYGLEPNTNLSLKCAIQIEDGSSATSYEPYSNICPISGRSSLDVTVNGNTETINLGDTVYGGTCDVVGGGTSDEWKMVDLGSFDWHYIAQYSVFWTDGITDEKKASGITVKCSAYKPTNNVETSSNITEDKTICLYIGSDENLHRIYVKDTSYNDENVFKLAVNGYQLCYQKAIPTTINTPATSISLKKGNNTLSTSGDNMELIYSKIPQ